jgi:hypothetical protein
MPERYLKIADIKNLLLDHDGDDIVVAVDLLIYQPDRISFVFKDLLVLNRH